MPVSHLTDSVATMLTSTLNTLTGGSFSHTTMSEDEMLARVVSEMTGQSYSHLTTSRETLWELLLTQAASDGITFDRNTQSNEQIAAIIANNVSAGGGEEYEGPLDLVAGAVVAYSSARALSADMLGETAYTIRRESDDVTQAYTYDAVTGEVPAATISAFAPSFNRTGATTADDSNVVLVSATDVRVGQLVTGAGIPQGATVANIDAAPTIVVDPPPTATNGSVSLTFHIALVTEAADHVGALDVAQGMESRQPFWVPNSLNGKPMFMFPVGQASLGSGVATNLAATGYTVFAVVNPSAPGAGLKNIISVSDADWPGVWLKLQGNNANAKVVMYSEQTEGGTYYTHQVPEGGGASDLYDEFAIIDAAWDADTSSLRINGAAIAMTSDEGWDALGAFSGAVTIGATAGGAEFLPGGVVELLVYNSILTDPQRLAIRQNIATHYGITLP